jgi:hypothetical protein
VDDRSCWQKVRNTVKVQLESVWSCFMFLCFSVGVFICLDIDRRQMCRCRRNSSPHIPAGTAIVTEQ